MTSEQQNALYLWMLKVRRDILAHEAYLDTGRKKSWSEWVADLAGKNVSLGPEDDLAKVRSAIDYFTSQQMSDPGDPPMPPYP